MRLSRTARPFALFRVAGVAALLALAPLASSGLIARVSAAGEDIVFVARQHLATRRHFAHAEPGPAGQFGTGLEKFAPNSKLMIRHANGSLTTLVDGANPKAATGYLIDVQSPDVSFDGAKILFAGAVTVDPEAEQFGWRLYEIGVNGQGFRRIPIPDRPFNSVPNNNSAGFDYGNDETYGWWSDISPAYLADGRIVFASTRYPSRAHYDGRYNYNLYVVNADGSGLHRITTERGTVLHPTPLPDGRILFSRWWVNFNQPSSTGVFNRVDNRPSNYQLADGTLVYGNPATYNPPTGRLPNGFEIRTSPNAWHLHAVNPDGTGFQRFAFTPFAAHARGRDSGQDSYTATQPALVFSQGEMFIAFTSQLDGTMMHTTDQTGIRVARPGIERLYANVADAIAGLGWEKALSGDSSPPYAIHPAGMPDGRILFSYADTPNGSLPTSGVYTDPVTGSHFDLYGTNMQYRLFTMNLDGSGKTALATGIGSADAMDAKVIVPRSGWAGLSDHISVNSSDDPRQWNVPADLFPVEYGWSQKNSGNIQTATIHNPNVYANAPLGMPFSPNSPPPGSVTTAEVWVDANQFTGAFCYPPGYPNPCHAFQQDVQNRAVKYTSVPVSPRGEFTAQVPADVPAFIVLRGADGRAVSGWNRGYISIAQGNAYARPGETVKCIGCHFGHVSGSITNSAEAEAGWTNVAPYATANASSENRPDDQYQQFDPSHVNDRRGWIPIPNGAPLNRGEGEQPYFQDRITGWMSATGEANGAWIELNWSTPVKIRAVRLVGPPATGGDWGWFGQGSDTTPYHITNGTLDLELNSSVVRSLDVGQVNSYAEGGTEVNFLQPIVVNKLRFTVNATAGMWNNMRVAALNEIEVMGMDHSATPGGPDPCSLAKPNAPALTLPAPAAKVNQLAVPLTWSGVECATKYKVLVSEGAPDGDLIVKERADSGEFEIGPLTPRKRYFWRIKACNKKGCKVSETWEFKIKKNAQ